MSIPKNTKRLIILCTFILSLILLTFFILAKKNTIFCRMSIALYEDNSPREMSSPGKLEAGQKILVKVKYPPWVLLQSGSIKGWLPEWYLTRNPRDVLPKMTPYLMVVKEETPLYLYPDYPVYRYNSNDEAETVETGVVVKVENEFNNWRYVRHTAYTIPRVQRGWVKCESLATRQEVAPLEGKIISGTSIYLGDGNEGNITSLPIEIVNSGISVKIEREKGEMVYVIGAGGWGAWVNKNDIIYDPFFE